MIQLVFHSKWCCMKPFQFATYTLKTGTPIEDGESILLRGVSHPEIQLTPIRSMQTPQKSVRF